VANGVDGEEKRGEKGSGVDGGSYGGPVARAERKKEQGVRGSASHGWENGEERGAPGTVGDSSSDRQ
jgi:hypothetical protein